jgi:membrane protease YdiL (CAAX protease family)
MLGFSLAWANATRLTAHQLGLGSTGVAGSLRWGLFVGVGGSILIRLFFGILSLLGRPVRLPEFQGLGPGRLAWVLAQFFLGSALFEEVAFRGVLHAHLVRILGTPRALLAGSAVFALWHTLITWYNVRRSGLPGGLFPLLYGGAMAVLVVAGLLFGALRVVTGHLAGAILAHWLMVANIVLSVRGGEDRTARGNDRHGA